MGAVFWVGGTAYEDENGRVSVDVVIDERQAIEMNCSYWPSQTFPRAMQRHAKEVALPRVGRSAKTRCPVTQLAWARTN